MQVQQLAISDAKQSLGIILTQDSLDLLIQVPNTLHMLLTKHVIDLADSVKVRLYTIPELHNVGFLHQRTACTISCLGELEHATRVAALCFEEGVHSLALCACFTLAGY